MKPQVIALLRELRTRGVAGLTPLEAFDAIGTLRLGARVWELREEGFDVETELITTPSGKRIARYRLHEQIQMSAHL